MSSYIRLTSAGFAGLLALVVAPLTTYAYQFDDDEAAYQDLYLATPIDLVGRVVDEQGLGLDGAQLRLIGFGEGLVNDDEATGSWGGGGFSLTGLARRSVLLEVSLEGYYTEIIPVDLHATLDETEVDLGDLRLVAQQFGRARLTFAGDVMFGRRMLDIDDDGVLGEANDLLHLPTLGPDTEALFRFVEPILHVDDHTAVNLETPVTDSPVTPHPTKSYVFHAYSDSAAVLPGVGVDSVSLGNNHVYDYLEGGMVDTLIHLDNIGIPYYGAGVSRSAAAGTAYRPTVSGVDLSMQGFCNLTGSSYGSTELEIIAYDDPDKGGALPSYSSTLDDFVGGELGTGRLIVPIVHGGTEYSQMQSSGTRNDHARLADDGANLVIGHHPHVVHGISTYDAGNGPIYVVGSLGNFVFDQEIFETFRSYMAVVDVVDGANGPAVESMSLVPFRIDGFVPRFMAGAAVDKMGRHVAHMSTAEAAAEPAGSNYGGAVVYAAGGRLRVAMDESEVTTTDLLDQRTLALSGGSTGAVALDPYTGTDALAALHSDTAASCELGRDLLNIGDFEDPDVDDTFLEGDLWEQSSVRYLQSSDVRNGTGGAVLIRKSSNSGRTSMYLADDVQVTPGSRITIQGWHKGVNAGEFEVSVRLRKSSGSTYSLTDEYSEQSSDYDWKPFSIDMQIPSNVETVQIYLRHYPPATGDEGRVLLDDISIIEWSPDLQAVDAGGVSLATPNGWDFVRCDAAGASLDLDLTHRIYE